MLVVQMTGLSGSGKSTIAKETQKKLIALNYKVEVIDGDYYRQNICKDLGFSKEDRIENINRLGFIALGLAKHNVISIIAAINPYEEARCILQNKSVNVRTVHIHCPLEELIKRDPKSLYKKALLPVNDPNHLPNFTGVTDTYEAPETPHLMLPTHEMTIEEAADKLVGYILKEIDVETESLFDIHPEKIVYKLMVNDEYAANLCNPVFRDMFWIEYTIIPLNSDYDIMLRNRKIWEEVQFVVVDEKGNIPVPHTFPSGSYIPFCNRFSERVAFRSLWPKSESNWSILKNAFKRMQFF